MVTMYDIYCVLSIALRLLHVHIFNLDLILNNIMR